MARLLQWVAAAAVVVAWNTHAALADLEGSKPHIVFVLFDDIGFNNVEWNSDVRAHASSRPHTHTHTHAHARTP